MLFKPMSISLVVFVCVSNYLFMGFIIKSFVCLCYLGGCCCVLINLKIHLLRPNFSLCSH